jgi:adenylyltransferase/sulfurtransferase
MSRYKVEGFTDGELDYYSRTLLLKDMGLNAQRRLRDSTVCVVGLGGLGSPVVMQLASLGVGQLRLVDSDVVEISNLQRQNLYDVGQVGLAKAEAASHRVKSINPFIEVEPVPLAVTALNANELIMEADVVVGALDSMAPRYALNRACIDQGISFVHGAAITYLGNITTIVPGATACLECFQGGVDDSELPSCAVVGVHPSLVNIVGSIMASEVVRLLTGIKPVLGNRLLFVDLEDLSFETIKLKRIEECPVCGEGSEPSPLSYEPVVEICGREGRRVFIFQPERDLGLSLDGFIEKLEGDEYEVYAQGELGFSFTGLDGVKGSLLSSGITIIEGFNDRELAERFYETLFS